MRRPRVALALWLLGLALVAVPSAASAADDPTPGKAKSAATVGIRTANAQGGDDRGVYDYEILPRGVVQDWVAISNYRTKPITVRLFAKDATSNADSSFQIQASADRPSDVGAWIALKKNKVTIPPRTEIVVPFQLGVPHDATPGDHSGAIVVSLLAKEPKPEGGSIIVDHRVGMRVHLRVPGDLEPALAIEKLKISWNGGSDVLGRGDAVVTYRVRNTGNVRLDATGGVELTRVLGLPSVEAPAAAVEDLLPGGFANYRVVVKNVFGSGPMKAEVSMRAVPVDQALADQSFRVTGVQGFAAWPWLLVLVVLAVLVLLGTGGRFVHRRRRARAVEQAELAAAEAEAVSRAKHRSLVRVALALSVLGAVIGTGFGTPATAAKGDQWQGTVSKKQGVALEPFDIVTSGGCPKPATNIVGFGYGVGFPKEGAVVISNNGPVSNEGSFTAAMVDSMKNIMALQPDPRGLKGTYKFVVRCIVPEFPDKSYGEYVAAIRFDSLDHWVRVAPLTRKQGPTVQIKQNGENGEPKAVQGQGGTTPPSSTTPGRSGAAAGERADDLIRKNSSDEGSGPSVTLLALGVAIALGSLALVFGNRIPGPWKRK